MGLCADRKLAYKLNKIYEVEEFFMWYFAWMLGVGFASCVGILNALWLEMNEDLDREADSAD